MKKKNMYMDWKVYKILGCSQATASKIKSSGIIDDAISQVGNVIVID